MGGENEKNLLGHLCWRECVVCLKVR
jgi:hypothetical protein